MPAESDRDKAGTHPGLVAALREGDLRALARAISVVENREPGFDALLAETRRGLTPRAHRVGITGPPGVGKSSLVREIVRRLRARGETVAVLAVDPSSDKSGGALLGDRIRMGELGSDAGVFFRSMAARDALGGLAPGAADTLDLMDAFGFSRVLVETVGVGQSERAVAGSVDSVVVVLMPGQGDSIQALKAGMTEIADLFVVNKAELGGAERLSRELREALELGVPRADGWSPPVLATSTESGVGVDALLDELDRHRAAPREGAGPRIRDWGGVTAEE
jgi:LAO/AO transport system kinase